MTICRQCEPFISREPKMTAPMQEPTANMASCRPRDRSAPAAFIVAVMDTSNAVKLDVEDHEHDQQWQNAPIRQYIARLGGHGAGADDAAWKPSSPGEGVGAAWSPAVWSAGAG